MGSTTIEFSRPAPMIPGRVANPQRAADALRSMGGCYHTGGYKTAQVWAKQLAGWAADPQIAEFCTRFIDAEPDAAGEHLSVLEHLLAEKGWR